MSADAIANATESAVVIPVPTADAIVRRHRAALDPAAALGVPAHVTVLFPFVPPARIDEGVLSRAAAVAAALPSVVASFGDIGWFDERVVFLRPQPDDWFRSATARMCAEFPDCPPYGGVYDDVVPHLTIGDRAPLTAMRDAAADVQRLLPVQERIDELVLMCGTESRGSWRTVAVFPLADGR